MEFHKNSVEYHKKFFGACSMVQVLWSKYHQDQQRVAQHSTTRASSHCLWASICSLSKHHASSHVSVSSKRSHAHSQNCCQENITWHNWVGKETRNSWGELKVQPSIGYPSQLNKIVELFYQSGPLWARTENGLWKHRQKAAIFSTEARTVAAFRALYGEEGLSGYVASMPNVSIPMWSLL